MDQDKAPSRPRGDRLRQTEINRRRLVQTALLGAAGVPLAAQAIAQGDGSGGGGGRGSRQGTPVATPVAQPDVIPAAAVETWDEPWVWRPSDWPGQQLELNVVENENPGATVGFGNPNAVLFSYNAATPGP
ncbi:MAG: hypothetical protein M3457_22685, partial [Chloroflexota bacterium]|nr:hypothetical protein [Chloroflexota bacterium]